MAIERWGSLSVRDHVDTEQLITNVLLYDRLVVPVMTDQPDRDEAGYWDEQGWKWELQLKRLEQLDALAVRKPWDVERRNRYKERVEERRAERSSDIDYYGITREILSTKEEVREELLPEGVTDATIIAAYNSESALLRDFDVGKADENLATQAYLLGRRLAVPQVADPDETLRRAIDLSTTDAFRKKRGRLFEWQQVIGPAKKMSAEAAVAEIKLMTDDYNDAVKKAYKDVKWKYAFTFAGAALSIAGIGASVAIPAAGVALGLVRLVFIDGKPTIKPGDAEPAAMFHDIKSKMKMGL